MPTDLLERPSPAVNPSRTSELTVHQQIHLVLSHQQHSNLKRERRRLSRHPYPYPIYLTPVDRELMPVGETIVVLGRHLSECGLDFYYTEPISYRKMIVSFPCGNDRWLGFVLELTWCRFNRHGWYSNGGRFLAAVDSPLTKAAVET